MKSELAIERKRMSRNAGSTASYRIIYLINTQSNLIHLLHELN